MCSTQLHTHAIYNEAGRSMTCASVMTLTTFADLFFAQSISMLHGSLEGTQVHPSTTIVQCTLWRALHACVGYRHQGTASSPHCTGSVEWWGDNRFPNNNGATPVMAAQSLTPRDGIFYSQFVEQTDSRKSYDKVCFAAQKNASHFFPTHRCLRCCKLRFVTVNDVWFDTPPVVGWWWMSPCIHMNLAILSAPTVWRWCQAFD